MSQPKNLKGLNFSARNEKEKLQPTHQFHKQSKMVKACGFWSYSACFKSRHTAKCCQASDWNYLCLSFFHSRCFDMDHFQSLSQYCFWFFVVVVLFCFVWPGGTWDLSSPTRELRETVPPSLEGEVLTTGLPGQTLLQFSHL